MNTTFQPTTDQERDAELRRIKWSEAKMAVDTIDSGLRVLKAEGNGSLYRYGGGIGPIAWDALDLTARFFEGKNFAHADYELIALDEAAGTYTIRARTADGDPPGECLLHSDGIDEFTE
jgi:hypothetical protein